MTETGTFGVADHLPTPAASEDLRFVAAVLRKDRKATAEFVDRYSDTLYAYLSNRLRPRPDLAEDLLQDVFLTAWERLSSYEGRSSLRNWLLGIARHKVEAHYRGRLRAPGQFEEEGLDEPLSPEPLQDDWLDREQMLGKAHKALDALPERYRMVLLWRYWEGRSAANMAGQIGRTEKAVERLLARARQAFGKEWSGE